jgi:autotransporter-associated beta strand protein
MLAMVADATPARSQTSTWNMYSGPNKTIAVDYALGPMGPGQNDHARINITVGDRNSPAAVIMDTGSTGIIVGSDHFTPGPNDKKLGPGEQRYGSSGEIVHGTYYQTAVKIYDKDGRYRATSNVRVLYVDQPEHAKAFYMGVGFNRTNGAKDPTPIPVSANPFLNIVGVSNLRRGYVIRNGGVVLGIPSDLRRYSFVKLMKNRIDWDAAPMTVSVTNPSGTSTVTGSGRILPDSGINYMYLMPPLGSELTYGTFAPLDTGIEISFPGQHASYGFKARTFHSADCPTTLTVSPCNVTPTQVGSPNIFVNTGREFFAGFDYLYDYENGYVGYLWRRKTGIAGGTSKPGVALTGPVTLFDGFKSSLPTFLFGPTTLQQPMGVGSATMSGIIVGPGSLTLRSGLLVLEGANTYSGGTILKGGTLQLGVGGSLPVGGRLKVDGGTLDLNGRDQTVGALSGLGGMLRLGAGTLTAGGAGNTTLATAISGSGGLVKQGTGSLSLTAANTYTGPTTVSNGRLAVDGSVASNVAVGGQGSLGGAGTVIGTVTSNGRLTPGNSIGTLSVVGSYTHNGGIYQVEVNGMGQADRLDVTGAGGTAILNGGTVDVLADPGVYAPSTTYTILSASGGVAGAFAGSSTNSPFLQSSLSYDASNAYLTLRPGGFERGARTANQASVGRVVDRNVARSAGDFAAVIGTMAALGLVQGRNAMDAIGDQAYSGFATAGIGNNLAFMNVVGQQMSVARGQGGSGGNRVALAEACTVACDPEFSGPWSAWGSVLGVAGNVTGDGTSATLTYNGGGVAAGVDYRMDRRLLVGLGVGFASGSQWLSGFSGRGTIDSYQSTLYASFAESAFYLDVLGGFGYSDNRMQRMIAIPGLQPRTARGQAGANQFFGQAETGYAIGVYPAAMATLGPFARLQAVSSTQAGFSETGASSLNLTVARQTTTSLRSTLGMDFAGAFDVGWRDRLTLHFRLGWAHEYASASRPVTASFAGAPGDNFTVFGAAPQRDTAAIGLAASTNIAASTGLYLRYDGDIGAGTDSHSLSAGLRMTW